jgi:hypothetical protein
VEEVELSSVRLLEALLSDEFVLPLLLLPSVEMLFVMFEFSIRIKIKNLVRIKST